MYCTNCGKEINDQVKFCPECGYPMTESGQKEVQNTKGQSAEVVNPVPIVRSAGGETVQPIGRTEISPKSESLSIAMLFGICRLVIGIISIVLCIVISLQSCVVGAVNLVADSGSVSGTSGVILAVSWLVAGIVGIAGRKHVAAVSTAAGFYFFGGLMALVDVGFYQDLIIWGFLSFAFGTILVLAVVLRKHEIFRKTWVSVLTELGVIALMLGIAFSILAQEDAKATDSKNNTSEISTENAKAEIPSESKINNGKEKDSAGKEKNQDTSEQVQYYGSVAALLTEINDNQIVAKQKYLDQVVSLDGEVSYIGGNEGDYYFSLADPFDPVKLDTINCYADESTVMSVKTGDYVTVTGKVAEGFWNLELKDCSVEYSDNVQYEDNDNKTESEYSANGNIAGYYGGNLGQSVLTISMYSAPENEAVGVADIYIDSEHPSYGACSYYGEMFEVDEDVYTVIGDFSEYVYLICDPENRTVYLMIDGNDVEEYLLLESYES